MSNQVTETPAHRRKYQVVPTVEEKVWRDAARLCRQEAEKYHERFPGEYEREMDACYVLERYMEGRAEDIKNISRKSV